MLHPFYAAYYSSKNRLRLADLAVTDLDTAEHLWGGQDSSKAFRNVLVGPPEQRGEIWQAWVSGNELELGDDPLFYVLHQTFQLDGKSIDRWAVYAALDVNEPSLFIHEDVLSEGVERARQGTEACEADLAPIFVGCEESVGEKMRSLLTQEFRSKKPLLSMKDSSGATHTVWPMESSSMTRELQNFFEGAPLFLLDGHHRLAAARENHRLGMGDGRILACICSMGKEDTLILPIHRAVNFERWTLPDALYADLVRAGCKVTELANTKVGSIKDFLEKHSSPEPYCLVLHSYADRPHLIELPSVPTLPPQLSALPVACLDHGVLSGVPQATCIPVPSVDLALDQLALDQAQAAFFLPASTPAQVRAIALKQLRMPRKSTRFVPKPALGLICRPWTNSG